MKIEMRTTIEINGRRFYGEDTLRDNNAVRMMNDMFTHMFKNVDTSTMYTLDDEDNIDFLLEAGWEEIM